MSENNTPTNEDWSQGWPAELRPVTRTSLTTNQHILHLILTIFTCGLWIPVWFIRAIQGNKVYPEGPARPPMPSSVYDPRFYPKH